MSLQFQTSINQYAVVCSKLWGTWRSKSAIQCMETVKDAIKKLVSFMPPLEFNEYFTADLGDFGYHQPANWSINLNRYHSTLDSPPLYYFIEWATTPYHECRHAEQTYRIAQGVLAGELQLPGKGVHQQFKAAQLRGVRDIRQAFETGKPLEMDRTQRKQVLKQWLGLEDEVVDHADSHRSYFANYLNSSVPSWYGAHADPVKDAVIDWMKMSYHGVLSDLDRKAQANAGKSKGFGRMYGGLAEEKDAFGVEGVVQKLILTQLGKSLPANKDDTPP